MIRDRHITTWLLFLLLMMTGVNSTLASTPVTRNYTAATSVTNVAKAGAAEEALPMVKITYGSGTWNSYAYTYDTSRGINYTHGIQVNGGTPKKGSTTVTFSVTEQPVIPDNGSYVVLEPLVNGTMNLDYYINNDPTEYCLLRVDGSTIEDYRYIAKNGQSAVGQTLTFAAEAGKKYYFFANGVTVKFFGFSLQYEQEKVWDIAQIISVNSITDKTLYSSFPISGTAVYRCPDNTNVLMNPGNGDGYLSGLAFHTDYWRINTTTSPENSIQNTHGSASRMFGISGAGKGMKLIVKSSTNLTTASWSDHTNSALGFVTNGNYYVGTIPTLSSTNVAFAVNPNGGVSYVELVSSLPYFSPAYISYTLGDANGFTQPVLYDATGTVVENSDVTYTSSNASVVKVSTDGHSYTPVGVGTATITATVGVKTVSLEVNVSSPALAWTSTKAVTVSLLDADNNNHIDDLIPQLHNNTGHGINYTPNTTGDNGANAAWFVAISEWETNWGLTNTKPRIRKPGTVKLTATDATDSNVTTSFSLTITDPGLTTGRYNAADNSYEFPNTGRLTAGATISNVAGVTMQYGAASDLPVVVNSGGKTVVKIIDGNGFSHPYVPDNNKNRPTLGTFYKFVATETGTLYVNGVFVNPKMYKDDGTEVPLTPEDGDYKADLTRDNTYYLYNQNSNQPMLHSFRYESQVDVVVGSSQWKFRNNTFADEIGDTGDGDWTYSSSNPSVVSFDNDTYGNATKTGIATIKAVGYATVTATKGGESHNYMVKVKQDDWNDLSTSVDGIAISGPYTTGTYNGGNALHPTDVPFTMSVPAIAGQTFKFVAGKTGGGGYNHDIYISNTTKDSYRLNNQNHDNTSWTSTVVSGAYSVDLSINDEKAKNGTYIRSVNTYFPTNTIAFGADTYKVSYLPNYEQTGQLATTANSSYNVLYVSSDASKVEVHPFTGRVTVKDGAAGQSVTITAYNLGEVGKYNGNSTSSAQYTLNVGAEEEFVVTVNVEDLMYMPGRVATYNGLDRQIPYLDIDVTGDDAAISNGTTALKLLHKGSNNGTLRITPRYISATKLTMNSLTLTFSEAPKAGEQLIINGTTVDLTGATTQEFTSFTPGEAITVSYSSIGNGVSIRSFQVGGTATSGTTAADLLDGTKAAANITGFIKTRYDIAVGSSVAAIVPYTGVNFLNLRGIEYTLEDNTGDHFSLTNGTLTAESTGTATLNAKFAGTYLFGTAASAVTTSLNAVTPTSTPAVVVANPLTTYTTDEIDAFVFVNEKVTLTPTIGGGTVPSSYTVTYTLSDESMAVINDDNSITTQQTPGLLTIRANFLPSIGSDVPVLSATTKVYVLSGQWNFSSITNTVTNTMQSAPSGWTDDPWHKSGSSNGSTRNTKEYQPILMDDGDLLSQSIALQTAYAVRMFNSGAIHLYGNSQTSYASENGNVGGVLRVPVRQGMTVTITAYNTTGENEEIELRGLNNLENTEAATTYYVNTGSTTASFIANNDNYIEIVNSTTNVNLFITSINVSNEMVFQYGNETYVKAGTSPFVNPVLNGGTSVMTYSARNVLSDQLSGIDTSTGVISFGSGYGQIEVTAAATGGLLDGQSSSYLVTILGFTLTNGVENLPSDNTKTVDLKNNLTIETGNIFDPDKNTAETAIKNKVKFSIESATNTASLSGTSLTMEGAGVVTLRATLGAISETFTYTLTGASLDVANAVIKRTKNVKDETYEFPDSYTITLNTASGVTPNGTSWFDIDRMKTNAMGTIKSKNKVDDLEFSESGNTLTISGFKGFTSDLELGGVIPIYASYQYNGATHYIEGTLTVAYAKHTWTFYHNLIAGDNSAAGVAQGINSGLVNWYSAYTDASNNTREGKWTSTATYDMPTDAGDAEFATGTANSHLDSHTWKFVRKMKDSHRESAIIYYYNHDVSGQNALVIPETQGLVIESNKNNQQLGVEMASERVTRKPNGRGEAYEHGWGKPLFYTKSGTSGTDPGYIYTRVTGSENEVYDSNGDLVNNNGSNFLGNGTQTYFVNNIMLLNGGKITIPELQKGQWVEVRWTRHNDDLGERILMTNLSDAAGTKITSTYKIGNCFYNLDWSTSTYMFQATEDGDVTFEVADNVYVSIQEIILHEPGWEFKSSMSGTLKGYDDTASYTETDKKAWTGVTAPDAKWVYLWNDDAASHTITLLPREYQNAPNAPQTWKFEIDEMLTREGAKMTTTSTDNRDATITYNGGWGKVKVTMTCYSQNMKYVANQKSWTITFGQAPKQTYPYTWDFTKFFSSTLGSTTNDITWAAVSYDSGSTNPLRVAIYNNHSSADYAQYPNTYNTDDYQSYYVEGGQLVSYGLRGTNNGVLRETEGLGFKLDVTDDGKPDQNMLLLNMTYSVAAAQQATNGQTWKTITGGGHQTESHLTIATGGKVIVPKPNDANFSAYYIYIKSSHEPSAYTNVVKMVKSSPGANEALDADYDVPIDKGVYKYQFSANADAEFTFTSSADATDAKLENRKYTDIYAIAVTKDFKTMKKLSGTGWATESRDYAVDYTLDSLLTTRPLQAFSVIARSSNPIYSENKAKTTVRLQDRNYVVPARQGLVLKQVKDSPGNNKETYKVPLFVPAVTTATDPEYVFANNLMRPNLTGEAPGTTNDPQTFTSETEKINGVDYTRFILSEWYMTWKKEESTVSTTKFIEGNVPGFYRLHFYKSGEKNGDATPLDSDDATTLNTLGANKAYLVLLTDKINDPIWNTSGGAKQGFIGIEGVSDMEEITEVKEVPADNAIYTLSGQRVADGDILSPGIYIRNGKKYLVK